MKIIGDVKQTIPNEDGLSSDTTDRTFVLSSDYEPNESKLVIFSAVCKPMAKETLYVGCREYEDYSACQKHRIISAKQISFEGIHDSCDAVMELARGDNAALIIHLDILDSKELPGGMTARELIYFVQRLKLLKNIKTIQIIGNYPEMAAKLVREFYKAST